MKKCANCGLECSDDTLSCQSCSTDSFISTSPEALGHIISPAEQSFWERMTFRQFAVFLIRLQSLWMFFYVIIYATYLLEFVRPGFNFPIAGYFVLLRLVLHLGLGIFCLRYADRIVSWFVKDLIPKTRPGIASVTDDKKS